MIEKPGQRRNELKFSRVEQRTHSDGIDLNIGLVRSHSFGHSGRAGRRGQTISDEYRHARYAGTLALNSIYTDPSSTDRSRCPYTEQTATICLRHG